MEEYNVLLQEALRIYDKLLALYVAAKQQDDDFASRTAADITVKRRGVAERLASNEPVSTNLTGTLIQSIGHYMDSHWDDFREIPTADPAKFARRAELHVALEELIAKLSQLHIRLKRG